MLKRTALVLMFAAVGVMLAGCGSVTVTKELNGQQLTAGAAAPIAHVNGKCWGLYFLPIFPLITGDAQEGGMKFLHDTVTLDNVVGAVTKESKDQGASKTTDLTSTTSSMWIPTPLILTWIKSVQVSGNAIK